MLFLSLPCLKMKSHVSVLGELSCNTYLLSTNHVLDIQMMMSIH